MALVTSPTTIPNLDYEYHTITIDTIGQDSANVFTCHLQQPLKNVVQARLLAAHINSNVSTKHCYVSIDELDSIFSDRASNVLTGQASMSMLRGSFASIVTDGNALISFKDNYTIATQYVDPIRRVDRLSVTIRDQNGIPIKPSDGNDDNFLVLRFVCRKPNL
jgi:hypothetical protein